MRESQPKFQFDGSEAAHRLAGKALRKEIFQSVGS